MREKGESTQSQKDTVIRFFHRHEVIQLKCYTSIQIKMAYQLIQTNHHKLPSSTISFYILHHLYNNINSLTMRNKEGHHHSHTGFVIIKGPNQEESRVKWEWLTQRNLRRSELNYQEDLYPRLSYSEKKGILSGLKQQSSQVSNFKIKDGFALKQKKRAASTASCTSLRSDRKLQPFIYLNEKEGQMAIPSVNFGIDIEALAKNLEQTSMRGLKLVGVISIRRMGLRFKLNHTFIQYSPKHKNGDEKDLRDITEQIKSKWKEYRINNKELYYFSAHGTPINTYEEIGTFNLKVFLVDSSPKLHFQSSLQNNIEDLAKKIESILGHYEMILDLDVPSSRRREDSEQQLQEEYQYDHQRIKNVREYVNMISQDPEYKLKERQQRQKRLIKWYQQKYTESPQSQHKKGSDKNLLFQSKCHYPQQIVDKKLLALASDKVESLPMTKNRHKFMTRRLDLMMEQIKREDGKQKSYKAKDRLLETPVTKKDMLWKLDQKNSLLSSQNIPYLIEKYGLNRFQLYNLYNLYKSFEKIAVMRDPNAETALRVAQKGVDRETFQAGLKGLDMNPGEELIKGICYFGDYISWEHFIKIISISLRKTPQEKLTAILKGISQFDTGYLSKHQISLMIGNSLHKLFDHEEEELKEYFTAMAMVQFDPEGTGKVEVELMKDKVLGKGSDNLNMVSFLILNT